jgi:hypothetical protein
MEIQNHDLAHEFPEFKDAIHDLKISNAHFAKLFDEYHLADKEVRCIEMDIQAVSDVYAEELKKKRLHLKDEIYTLLRNGGVPAL